MLKKCFSCIFNILKNGQFGAPFWDLKFVKYMETNVFLGSLFLDLKGTSFLLIKAAYFFPTSLSKKIYFAMGGLKMMSSLETHHIYIWHDLVLCDI